MQDCSNYEVRLEEKVAFLRRELAEMEHDRDAWKSEYEELFDGLLTISRTAAEKTDDLTGQLIRVIEENSRVLKLAKAHAQRRVDQ